MTIANPARFAVLLLALILAALNLRPALTSVAPLMELLSAAPQGQTPRQVDAARTPGKTQHCG